MEWSGVEWSGVLVFGDSLPVQLKTLDRLRHILHTLSQLNATTTEKSATADALHSKPCHLISKTNSSFIWYCLDNRPASATESNPCSTPLMEEVQ